MTVAIRPFKASDAQGIVALHELTSEWFEDIKFTESFVHASAMREDFRFYVADLEDSVVGFCGVLFYEGVGRAEVGPLCVHPKHRFKGTGRQLVGEVLQFLKQRNIHRVTSKVKSTNGSAVNFFLVNGFEVEARLQRFTRAGEEAIQLVRFLG